MHRKRKRRTSKIECERSKDSTTDNDQDDVKRPTVTQQHTDSVPANSDQNNENGNAIALHADTFFHKWVLYSFKPV